MLFSHVTECQAHTDIAISMNFTDGENGDGFLIVLGALTTATCFFSPILPSPDQPDSLGRPDLQKFRKLDLSYKIMNTFLYFFY